MISKFVIIKDNIKEAYDDVTTFEDKIIKYKEIDPTFHYELKLINDNNKWNVLIKIWRNEEHKKILHKSDVDLLKLCK